MTGCFSFVLSQVAFGYGLTSDTQFLKFSDKDWIWICKNYSVMDQELKQIFAQCSPLIQTRLDQIFGQYCRIRIGLDYTVKILDWIRIAKISDPFNTNCQSHTSKRNMTIHFKELNYQVLLFFKCLLLVQCLWDSSLSEYTAAVLCLMQ